jgi:hypothetical protein
MNVCSYDLYEDNTFIKHTDNKKYALFWILENYIKTNKTKKYYFDIINNISKNDTICIESIKIENDKVIKINKYNNYYTVYSPYDLDVFDSTELSLLYQTIYKFDNKNNIIINNNKDNNKDTKKDSSLEESKNIVKENKTPKKEDVVFDKKELEDMAKLLESLKDEKKNVDKIFKEKENELADIDCNERFENKKKKIENERNKEKYNIFKSDINIYNKLINEDNFSENFIPPFFEAKYYILKFLFINDYFNDENKDSPSEEIFELFRTLYDYMNDDEQNIDVETFGDLYEEYDNFLPKNKKIMTDRQMMDTLNEKSENTDLFKETTGFENNTDTDTDTDTDI